jgi:hypothetical protein
MFCVVCGAVVLTVMVTVVVAAVPFAAMDDGLNAHVASDGKPEQARLIVPLKLLEFATVIDVVPEEPGAEIEMLARFDAINAKNPGWIVKLTGAVLLLA